MDLILLIAGIYALFAKKIAVTKKSDLHRPYTYYFAFFVLIGIIVIGWSGKFSGDGRLFLYFLGFLIPIISLVYLKKPKVVTEPTAK